MEKYVQSWTLAELALAFGGELVGSGDIVIERPAPAGSNDPRGLTFAGDDSYLAKAEASGIAAILVKLDSSLSSKPGIRVKDPRGTFARFLHMCARPLPLEAGIHPTAVVSPLASVSPSASIGPFAVVEQHAVVGDGCRVFPFVYVGENCRLGSGVVLHPHVVLYQDVKVGDRSVIHSGSVLGADGFGYVWDGKTRVKVPQVGSVTIGADVEIGALTTIDRATAGETTIGDGTKIDNLVQIAHNNSVGEHSVIASQTGIGGSSEIGDRVVMAGQTAIADHMEIGNDVTLIGRAGVTKNISEPGVYFGYPARPYAEGAKVLMSSGKLPDMLSRLRDLEKRISQLEKK